MVTADELKSISLFKDLPDSMIETLVSVAETTKAEEETVLFRQDENLGRFFVLLSGKVFLNSRSPRGKVRTIDEVRPGQCFGVSAIIGDHTTYYTAICGTRCRLVSIPADRMNELFAQDRKLGCSVMLNVVKLFKDRMDRHTRQFLASLANHPLLKADAARS